MDLGERAAQFRFLFPSWSQFSAPTPSPLTPDLPDSCSTSSVTRPDSGHDAEVHGAPDR